MPLMVAITIVFFLCITLPLLVNVIGDNFNDNYGLAVMDSGVYMAEEQSMVVAILVSGIAVILALIANSYMHSKRMVDVYHSIPVTRPQLLTANFAASMTTLLVPFLGVVIVTFSLQLLFLVGASSFTFGGGYFWYLIQDILGIILCAAICYLFVTFVSVNVGTVFDTFAIAAVLGFSLTFVFNVSGLVWADLTYGASFQPGEYSLLLSPFTFVLYKFILGGATNSRALDFPVGGTLLFYLICLVLAAVLYFAAVACYRRRKSETAEKPQANGIFQTIVKVVAAFVGAAFLYLLFADLPLAAQVIGMVFGAVLIGIIAELILSRGIHHLRRNLKWLVGTGAICAVAILLVHFDVFGYVSKVPAPDTVESVSINYRGRFDYLTQGVPYGSAGVLTQPDSIAVITEAHKMAVDRYAKNGEAAEHIAWTNLRLEYTLKNGSTLTRYYNWLDLDASDHLTNLEDQDDFITAFSPLFWETIDGQSPAAMVESLTITDRFRSTSNRLILGLEDTERLLSAIKADMLSESLEEILHPTKQALGYITVDFYRNRNFDGQAYSEVMTNFVVVTPEYTQTIALLKEFGAYEKMTQLPTVPDRVYITPTDIFLDRVLPLTPDGSNDRLYQDVYAYMRDSYGYYADGIVFTEDKAQVEQILAASRNQMFVVRDRDDEPTYYAVFCSGETVIGTLLLRKADLPPDLQEQMGTGQRLDDGMIYPERADMELPAVEDIEIGGADSGEIIVVN
jgi:ABC-2 type transport system permease protein